MPLRPRLVSPMVPALEHSAGRRKARPRRAPWQRSEVTAVFQDLQPMRGETMRRARSSHRADRRIDAAPAHHLGRASIEASLQRSRLKSGLLDQATARLLARLQPLGQYRAAVRSAAAISCCAVSIRRRIRGFPRNISLSLRTCALGAPHPRHAAWLGRSRSDRSRAESRCD